VDRPWAFQHPLAKARCAFGDLNQYGRDAFMCYTKTKIVTARWFCGMKDGAALKFTALD
jgi:malonate-semialdehyde dehydrogenase (acetylating)/methylmalonate-semialdehyde dehydrogenase